MKLLISKTPLTVLVAFLFLSPFVSKAQISNGGIFFQAIARDNMSNPAKDRKIYVQSSIIQNTATGNIVLSELHQTNTDPTGIFSIGIGQGVRTGGLVTNLTNIPWAQGPFFLNLKIAISPTAPIPNWDYTKEWIDLGTTPFGTVPYALYAGSAAGLNDKLSISDTTSMLAIYAKAQAVKTLESTVNTKVGVTDTAAMLVPYRKMVNEIIASNITSLTAGSINSALNSKVNLADSAIVYITPMQLKSVKFDTTSIVQRIDTKLDKVTGIAGSATKLATARNINGVAFDGSGDITITSTADAETLTGTTLKSTVTGSSLTSVGTLTNLTVTNPIAGSVTGNAATATNLTGLTTSVATLNNLSGVNSGDQTTITGNAGTATKLAASKTINGVAFDGTEDITAPAAAETLTGTTLKSTVTGSSLTSVGTLTNLTVTNPIAGSVTGNAGTATNLTGLTTSVATLNNLSGVNSGDQTTITGNAATASKLATARNINGVAFDGSGDITITSTADAGTLTGTTLKSTVTGSSLTSVGTLTNLTVTNPIAGSVTGNAATATNLTGLTTSVATLNNLSGVNSGDQTTITGNAATATKLATARNINGVAFDGTADITAPAAAETLTGSTLKSTVTGSSLTSVGTITSGVWSGTAVAIQKGGTGLTTVGTNGQVLTSNGTSITWATPASSSSSSPTYTTGLNSDLGGYVFFLSTDSKHGLVAETENQSTSSTWYDAENNISNQANHSTNGKKFTDWRLPTKHELNLMYAAKNSIFSFTSALYWSSTEYVSTLSWLQDFSSGNQIGINKNDAGYVRAVRAF